MLPVQAVAAEVSLSAVGTATVGAPLLIDVLVDPEGESINSADVTVLFDADRYTFSGYLEEEGVLALWVAPPHESERGRVQFSGVILGGVERVYDPHAPNDHAVPLVRLRFVPHKEGDSSFAIARATLLRNDGIGSSIVARTGNMKIAVDASSSAIAAGEINMDEVPPLPFTIAIVDDSLFGKSPRLAVFDAHDRESGIRAYEVRINGRHAREVQSPYALPRRLFPYTLTARAIDFAGNYRDAEITVRGGGTPLPFAIAAVLMLGIVWYMRRTRGHASLS